MYPEEQLKTIRLANGKTLYEVQLRRARITAIVLSMAVIVTFIFLVFAHIQKERARGLEAELVTTKQALEKCVTSK